MSAMGQKQTSRRHLANVRFASQSGHVRVASGSPAQKVYILHKKLSLSGALCAKPAVGVAALPALPRIARAQAYPARPVRIVVGFPAGGAPDIIARLIGQVLSERLGQQFVIENRPGAASNIGTEIVVKAPPNGYTLLMVVATNTVNATLYTNLNFNFIRDIAPVASIAGTSYGMLVN